MNTFNELDKQKALDGDLGARLRQEVIVPFSKIMKEHLNRLDSETIDRQKRVDRFNDQIVASIATAIIAYLNVQGVRGGTFELIMPAILGGIYEQALSLHKQAEALARARQQSK